jgi:hypothetical protein
VLREDYLERMIRQLAQALARILGLRRRGETEAALEELDGAVAAVAGLDPRAVEASDPAVLAALLRDPARLAALGRLLAERAGVEDDRGEGERAAATRARALGLLLEASLASPLDPEALACARALRAAGTAVAGRHAAAAEALGG